MKWKLKHKLILDALMFVVIWVVMEYKLTGNLVHEILGVLLILAFLLHVLVNRKYYLVMAKQLFRSGTKAKNRVSYIVNVVLLAATVVMVVSSVVISRDLFAFLGITVDSGMLWRNIHVLCAVTMLVCVFVHCLLHLTMLLTLFNNKVKSITWQKVSRVGSRVLAVVLAIAVLRLSLHNVIGIALDKHGRPRPGEFGEMISDEDWNGEFPKEPGPGKGGKPRPEDGQRPDFEGPEADEPQWEKPGTDRPGWQEAKPEESGKEESVIEESRSGDDTPTLEEYLKSLTCKGCGRRCGLLTPQCRKGDNYANQAKTEYYSTYGEH